MPCCVTYILSPLLPSQRKHLPKSGIAHHYGRTGKGTGQKCSDYETVPLNNDKHIPELHAKGKKWFEKEYNIENIDSYFESVKRIYFKLWLEKKSNLQDHK